MKKVFFTFIMLFLASTGFCAGKSTYNFSVSLVDSVDTKSDQTITGQKTFAAPVTISSNVAVTGEFTAPGYGRKNAIINGCGMINQRRDYVLREPTYIPVSPYQYYYITSTGAYDRNADRFLGACGGSSAVAVFTSTDSAPCGVSGYAFMFSSVTLTGSGEVRIKQRIESLTSKRFINKKATLSFKTYQNTGGIVDYTCYVRKVSSTTADYFSMVVGIATSTVVSVPNMTDTYITFSDISMEDCSKGIEIEIVAACGAVSNKIFYFTELQFEKGSLATDYEFREYTEELQLCQRYYQSGYSALAGAPLDAYTGGYGWGIYLISTSKLPTVMRATPSVGNLYWSVSVYKGSGTPPVDHYTMQYYGNPTMQFSGAGRDYYYTHVWTYLTGAITYGQAGTVYYVLESEL
jgi:hypothetical protein